MAAVCLLRYVDYVGQLVASPPFVPHMQKMKLSFITLTTIPMFNLNKYSSS